MQVTAAKGRDGRDRKDRLMWTKKAIAAQRRVTWRSWKKCVGTAGQIGWSSHEADRFCCELDGRDEWRSKIGCAQSGSWKTERSTQRRNNSELMSERPVPQRSDVGKHVKAVAAVCLFGSGRMGSTVSTTDWARRARIRDRGQGSCIQPRAVLPGQPWFSVVISSALID